MVCTLTSVVTHGSHLHCSQDLGEREEGEVNMEDLTLPLHGTTSFITAQSLGHMLQMCIRTHI